MRAEEVWGAPLSGLNQGEGVAKPWLAKVQTKEHKGSCRRREEDKGKSGGTKGGCAHAVIGASGHGRQPASLVFIARLDRKAQTSMQNCEGDLTI